MKLNYRPEIDGLRALAVISVVLYHAKFSIFNFNIFSGGFLGVDIFFVISGYLITLIILKELSISKKFSFINFYERRARRIIPAFFFILIFISPLAWLILLPLIILFMQNLIFPQPCFTLTTSFGKINLSMPVSLLY